MTLNDLSIELITPEIAAHWLSTKNVINRKISNSTVSQYVSEIQSGNWSMNGETVKFDINGNLLDGQHRLTGIVKSGKAIETIVVRNLAPSCRPSIDRGRIRTNVDYALMDGNKDATFQIPVIHYLGRALHKIIKASHSQLEVIRGSHLVGLNWLFQKRATLTLTERKAMSFMNKASVSAALAYAYEFNQEKVDQFYEGLRTGAGLKQNSPILTLRNCLTNLKARQSQDNLFVYTLAALYRHLHDEEMKYMVFSLGSKAKAFFNIK